MFLFFIVCFVHWRLCSLPIIQLFSCCSTFLLLNPHFAFNCPFILTHFLLFCYPPIVQLEFFFSSRHHACTLVLWLLLGSPLISLILLLCYLYFALSCFCTSVSFSYLWTPTWLSFLVSIHCLFEYGVLFHNWSELLLFVHCITTNCVFCFCSHQININIHSPRLFMTCICHFFELHGIYIVIKLQYALNNCILLTA